jgi:hypothetical protein
MSGVGPFSHLDMRNYSAGDRRGTENAGVADVEENECSNEQR